MEFLDFCYAIKKVIESYNEMAPTAGQSEENHLILSALDDLTRIQDADTPLNMTRATVLFEGLYRHFSNTPVKNDMGIIRVKRWSYHFGTPTIPFLLSYKKQIAETTKFFNKFTTGFEPSDGHPWFVSNEEGLVVDHVNNIIVNPASISHVESPQSREVTGTFTKTHNPSGGFTTTPCDPVSQKFLAHAASSAQCGGKVLEIGAAFGAATLEAISKGATVFCNDIDPENLAVVRQRYLAATDNPLDSITGDDSKLILIPGELPQDLIGLPQKYFDAILICRVLHFFSGAQIDESIALLSKLLAPGGKIYIVCETPFLKNWQRFIPEFHRRVERGIEWPGEITNPAEYESSGRAASLPKFVHWITKEILERSLARAGFAIEHVEYINRSGQFPEDLLLPEHGKESVGAIGRM